MKKLVWVLVGVLTFIFTPVTSVRAEQSQRGLLLVEVQTGSANSASEEFIELYNNGSETLDLSKYSVQYFSASTSGFQTPSRSIALSGLLYPHGRYLLSSTNYLIEQADATFTATLAKTGGHLRLVSNDNNQLTIHDLLGWGAASTPETHTAAAPNGGESLQRKISSDGSYQDTDDNSEDFMLSIIPTPESNNPQPEPTPEEEPTPDPTPEPPVEEAPSEPTPEPEPIPTEEPVSAAAVIHITELLPNPVSPQTDAEDEFVEIYNPNNEPVVLEGYRLETGNTYSYHFVFGDITIQPNSYLVVYSRDTNLTLSNTSGQARLLGPNGEVVSETSPYDTADEGASWIFINGIWQWTTSPTPGGQNSLSASVSSTTSKPKATAAKKTSTSAKKSTAKVASAKATKPKSTTAKTKKDAKDQSGGGDQSPNKSFLHPAILAGVGLLAVGYGAYEYRESIANQFHKLRNFRKNRGGTGQPS